MEQDSYSNLTDAETRQLDVSMNMALIYRNGFVKYLKQVGFADADIMNVLAESADEEEFYQNLARISAGRLSVDVLRSNMGAEEYKVLVNFARNRLGVKPLFPKVEIDDATYDWLSASEDTP
jgi:hypothetical protein